MTKLKQQVISLLFFLGGGYKNLNSIKLMNKSFHLIHERFAVPQSNEFSLYNAHDNRSF